MRPQVNWGKDMDNTRRPVLADEIAGSYVVPTIAINRFLVTTHTNGVRIAFGESAYLDSPIVYRTAMMMSHAEAEELKNVLDILLRQLTDEARGEDGEKAGA